MILNKATIIGITGGIGTGKSTVTKLIKEKGYIVLDADKIAREVVEKGKPALEKISKEFGKIVIREDGELDRKALGNIIFNDKLKRKKLNNIIHSYIFESIKSSIIKMSEKQKVIFLDIPLLFEEYDNIKEFGIIFDEIWLVYLDRNTQLQRIIKRDSISREYALARINSQIDIEKKKDISSEILDNSGTIKELELQLEELLKRL